MVFLLELHAEDALGLLEGYASVQLFGAVAVAGYSAEVVMLPVVTPGRRFDPAYVPTGTIIRPAQRIVFRDDIEMEHDDYDDRPPPAFFGTKVGGGDMRIDPRDTRSVLFVSGAELRLHTHNCPVVCRTSNGDLELDWF